MIVVDTNVLSEPLRRQPDPSVLRWLAENAATIAITTITVTELLYGALRLRSGRRRTALLEAIDELVRNAGDRLLSFDEAAARTAASLRVARDKAGRPVSVEDTMIAAIAHAHGAAVATRNISDFGGLGLALIDPWRS